MWISAACLQDVICWNEYVVPRISPAVLQQNWAVVIQREEDVLVVFYGDTSGVFDEMPFTTRDEEAEQALRRNCFSKFLDDERAQEFIGLPRGEFEERPHPNGRIYSSGRFWHWEAQQAKWMQNIGECGDICGILPAAVQNRHPAVHDVDSVWKPKSRSQQVRVYHPVRTLDQRHTASWCCCPQRSGTLRYCHVLVSTLICCRLQSYSIFNLHHDWSYFLAVQSAALLLVIWCIIPDP